MAIEFKVNGNAIKYRQIRIKESFNQISSVVEFDVFADYGETVFELEGGQFFPVQYKTSNDDFVTVVCYPKSYVDWCKKLYQPYCDDKTFEEMMQFYGIQLDMLHKSSTSHWVLPETRFNQLLQLTKNQIKIPNGGGVVLTVGYNGKLRVCDLKKAFESNEIVSFMGRYATIVRDRKFTTDVPMSILFQNESIEKDRKEKTLEILPNITRGVMTSVYFNDKSYDSREVEINNIQCRSYYTSKYFFIEDATFANEIYLGQKIQNQQTKENMVVFGYTITATYSDQKISVTAVSKP